MTNAVLSVAAILKESADRFPDRVAIVMDDSRISYSQLWQQTRSYAGALRELGVGESTPVAVLIPNVPDFARVYYAILALGGIVVPVHALLKADEIEFILRDSGARILVCAAPLLSEGARGARQANVKVISVMAPNRDDGILSLEQLALATDPIGTYIPRAPLETATILYTSGTTGKPKGAMSSHFSLVEQTHTALVSTFDMTKEDIVFGGLPLFHTFGQTCTLNTTFRAGATLVLLPRFDGATALRTMIDMKCTIFMGVPTMYVALVEAAAGTGDRPQLRYAISGGAAISSAVMERVGTAFGIQVHEGYGMTETAPVVTFNHVGREPRVGSIGTPVWGVEVEIADADIETSIELLPVGEVGELVIRGHGVMNGYLNQAEESSVTVIDGWFRTGDLGSKDVDGYLWIVDRKKDMIIRNGYNVYPREIEDVLIAHPCVSNAAVFGVPHPAHGQEIVAHIILRPTYEATSEELLDYARSKLAAYKYPRIVEIVTSLPLGPSGKVLKRNLSSQYVSAAGE